MPRKLESLHFFLHFFFVFEAEWGLFFPWRTNVFMCIAFSPPIFPQQPQSCEVGWAEKEGLTSNYPVNLHG